MFGNDSYGISPLATGIETTVEYVKTLSSPFEYKAERPIQKVTP